MIPEKDQVLKRSMDRLEFRELLAFLSELTRSEPGRTGRAFAGARRSIWKRSSSDLELLKEMIDLLNSGAALPLGYFSDVSKSFENARLGSMLSALDLLEILRLVEQAEAAKNFLRSVREKFSRLSSIGDRIQNFADLKSRLARSIDEHGEIKNSASRQLAGLRSEFASLRGQIQKTLERMLSTQKLEDVIQDSFYTEREGRFVIPVKSSGQSRVSGIVHDTSASGATVFIEPIEMVPQNNRLRVLEGEIQAEIVRILQEITGQIAELYEPFKQCLAALIELDLVQAKAELARKLSASIPVVEQGPVLALYKVRHPLLVLKGNNAVPNDIALDAGYPGAGHFRAQHRRQNRFHENRGDDCAHGPRGHGHSRAPGFAGSGFSPKSTPKSETTRA